MRRLLIRLIALETMLVGFLSYWLFLVYANNPSVSQSLVSQLGRFPQLAFTTVDISVLVVMAILAVFLGFKFQRGLRPGIRLERALQMLENLMKRNLLLEAQVADLKLEKAHVGAPAPVPPSESKIGSWERAFRTPIEAGAGFNIAPAGPIGTVEISQEHDIFPPRAGVPKLEQRLPPAGNSSPVKPVSIDRGPDASPVPERTSERSSSPISDKSAVHAAGPGSATWEDSPKRAVEVTGILTPSPMPKTNAGLAPVSEQRQPYIPVPVPKGALPNVVVGPGVQPPSSSSRPVARTPVSQGVPKSALGPSSRPASSLGGKPPGPLLSPNFGPVKSAGSNRLEGKVDEAEEKDSEKTSGDVNVKPTAKSLKKFPYEED